MDTRHRALGALVGIAALLGAALAYSDPAKTPPAKAPAASAKLPLPAAASAKAAADKAKKGVVVLERKGQPLALGFILARDGRILTALSPLGDGNAIDVRYADGGVVRAHVGHSDRMWDLALLVPEVARGADGLVASESDPFRAGADLAAFTSAQGKAQPLALAVKGHRTFLGADDALLRDAIDLAGKLGAKDLGTPILDDTGGVVGIVARGCVPLESGSICSPVPFGAPVPVLRKFLSGAPDSPPPVTPWLGMQVIADATPFARGVRVQVVQPESPADEAHLRGGANRDKADLVVAVDGAPVTSPEALSDAIREHAVGDRLTLLVFSDGKFRDVPVILRAAPAAAEVAPPPGRAPSEKDGSRLPRLPATR